MFPVFVQFEYKKFVMKIFVKFVEHSNLHTILNKVNSSCQWVPKYDKHDA